MNNFDKKKHQKNKIKKAKNNREIWNVHGSEYVTMTSYVEFIFTAKRLYAGTLGENLIKYTNWTNTHFLLSSKHYTYYLHIYHYLGIFLPSNKKKRQNKTKAKKTNEMHYSDAKRVIHSIEEEKEHETECEWFEYTIYTGYINNLLTVNEYR